jgi:hypothetical protein
LLSLIGLIVCASILVVTLAEKFTAGGWLTLLITSAVVTFCWFVKGHYAVINTQVRRLDKLLTLPLTRVVKKVPPLDPQKPTAAFLISDSIGQGMHTLLWVQRMFPNHFRNFVFMSAGVVDVGSYGSEVSLKKMQKTLAERLQYFIDFSQEHGLAAVSRTRYGNDPIEELEMLAEEVNAEFPNTVFFSATLIATQDNWFHRKLHSEIPILLQRHLLLRGMQMVVIPVKLEDGNLEKG